MARDGTMPATRAAEPTNPHLQRSIGLGRVLFQSIGLMGPGASIVFGLGLIIANTGQSSPFAMVVALIAALLVAVSIGQLAARIPGAGGLYSYAAAALGSSVGFLVGWGYTLLSFIFPPVGAALFAVVGQDFCNTYLHFNPPWWPLALIALGVTLANTYFGVKISTTVTLVLGTVEVTILLLVSILLVIHAGGSNSLSVFNPANAAHTGKSTINWVFLGVVYAVAVFTGFESSVQLAEEAEHPRYVVPRAVVLSVAAIGIFYVFAMYTAVVAWGPTKLDGYLTSPDPWREMGNRLGGFFAFLVVLAILNSLLALTQAAFNSTTRLLMALGRARNLPEQLGRVHPMHHTPYVAAFTTGALSLIALFVAAYKFNGPFNTFVFMITVVSLMLISLYIVTMVGCIVYFLTRRRADFNPWLHLLAPIVGLALLLPALYYSGQGLTYPASWSIPTILIWMGIGLVLLIGLRVTGRDIASETRRWTGEAANEDDYTKGGSTSASASALPGS